MSQWFLGRINSISIKNYRKDDELIFLEENQSDSICFRFKGDLKNFTFLGYYLLVTYAAPSDKLTEHNCNELNNELFNANSVESNDVNRGDAL